MTRALLLLHQLASAIGLLSIAFPSGSPTVITMLSILTSALAAPAADLVTSLPGFNLTGLPFKAYSGYLTVPGPFTLTDYDSLEIH